MITLQIVPYIFTCMAETPVGIAIVVIIHPVARHFVGIRPKVPLKLLMVDIDFGV